MTYSRFNTKRGRPRATLARDTDLGTPELIMKKACGQTSEAIDLCLERGLIDRAEHRAGLHLRWLYTLRYGAPGVSAMDLLQCLSNHHNERIDDSLWRQEREAEYETASQRLIRQGYFEAVSSLCIHNQMPRYLDSRQWQQAYGAPTHMGQLEYELSRLQKGLNMLVRLWKKPVTSSSS